RQLPDVVEHQALTGVVDGIPPIKLRKRLIRGKAITARGAVARGGPAMPCGTVINGVAVGIVTVDQQAVTHLPFDLQLEGIVVRVDHILPRPQPAIVIVGRTAITDPGSPKIVRERESRW